MIFHEVYGVYYTVLAVILSEAVKGTLTSRRITKIVHEKAFGESVLTIPAALKQGDWPLINAQNRTPIQNPPAMPLTTLEKRWLKALLLDPRVALFSPDAAGLEDVEPLFRPEHIVRYDQYSDGDPYTDPDYIARFRLVLQALHEHRRARIRFRGQSGYEQTVACVPLRLEYSAKDDKFRLLTTEARTGRVINLGRVTDVALLEEYDEAAIQTPVRRQSSLVFLLRDERNALERVMLHFSHFEKKTLRQDENLYQVTITYDQEDEAELLIRILSFGPMIRVISPDDFISRLKKRLENQRNLNRGAMTG